MADLLSALVGALIGGAISAAAVIWQTRQTLRHDVHLAREEREESRRAEMAARQATAATRLLETLAIYMTPQPARAGHGSLAWFGGRTTEFDVRAGRIADLRRVGNEVGHLLPDTLSRRWRTLVWLAQWAARQGAGDSPTCNRDASDAWSYAEYVRRSLVAFLREEPLPPEASPPDHGQPGRERVWGWRPPEGVEEPDLTDWIQARLGGDTVITDQDGTKHRVPPEP
jgi:hypothetical protein